MSNWKDIKKDKPLDGQKIIAQMKHGIVSCYWDESTQTGQTYIWQPITFYVIKWIDLIEFEKIMGEE